MSNVEIVGLIVSILGVGCFAAFFTILYMTYSKSTIKEYQNGKRDIELIDEAIYDNLSNVKKRRKIIRTIKSIGFYGLMIIIIPFFTFSLMNKFSGNVTMINNKGVLVVASGSMSQKNEVNDYIITNDLTDQFNAFEIIVIEKVDNYRDLEKYDVISFINDEGENIIHRIINIEHTSKGVQFETRGDSNTLSDKYHPTFEDIQGRYTGVHIPYIGLFILFMQSYIGMITICSLVYCLFMIEKFSSKIYDAQNKRLKILSEVIDINEEMNSRELHAKFNEIIYYKGYEYLFNEEGFVEKNVINDKNISEESNSLVIKIREEENSKKTILKKPIDNNEENTDKDGKEVE